MNKNIKIGFTLLVVISISIIALYIDSTKDFSSINLATHIVPKPTAYTAIESTPTATRSTEAPIQPTNLPNASTAAPTEAPESNTYYVSSTGDNHNPGTLNAPWRTIAYAVENIKAGDTLYVRGGIYQETIVITADGTPANTIMISGYPDEEVIIDGNGNTLPAHNSGAYLVKILGDYVRFSNMTIQNSGEHGIGVFGSYSQIAHLIIFGNWRRGAGLGGDYEVAEYLDVHDNGMVNYQGSTGQDPTALTAGRSPNFATIRHCKVYRNWGIGLSTYESTNTIMEDNISFDNYSNNIYISDATDVLFQRNLIYSTGFMDTYGGQPQTGIAVWDEIYQPASARITIINNIVYGTRYCLRWLSGPLGDRSGMNHIFIANNTFANSTEGSCISFKESPIHDDSAFINNIVIQDNNLPPIIASTNSNILFSNNLWSSKPVRVAQSPSDIIGDPMLTRINTFSDPLWYQLLPDSPAIDHASVLPEVSEDFWGNPRGSLPDIGAIEYVGTLSQAQTINILPESISVPKNMYGINIY
jgi:hypothetical protein